MSLSNSDGDTPKSLLNRAAAFFTGTMLSRFTGLARDLVMAYAFGTEAALAAFLVAFRLAHMLRRLFAEGALQTAFIPTFEELRSGDSRGAGSFFLSLYSTLTIGLGAICALAFGTGVFLYQSGAISLETSESNIPLLTLLMSPSLLFICLYGLNSALLQCNKKYFLAGAAPVAFNIVWIAGLLLLKGIEPNRAMLLLTFFIIGASACQWLITLPTTLSQLLILGVKDPWKQLRPLSPAVRRLAAPLTLAIIGVGASQVNNALDVLFARGAEVEGPAFLWYAMRLIQFPLALIGVALSSTLLPALSRAIKCEQNQQYSQLLEITLQRSQLLLLPLTFLLLTLGSSTIQLLFGHGDFGSASIAGTTQCLWGYAAGLPALAAVLILAPAFYSRGEYTLPTRASSSSVILNIALNSWFVFALKLGAASIAYATSLCAWVNTALLAVALSKVATISWSSLAYSFGTSLGSSIVAAAVAQVWKVEFLPTIFQWFGISSSLPFSFAQQIFTLGSSGMLFTATYCAMNWGKLRSLLSDERERAKRVEKQLYTPL